MEKAECSTGERIALYSSWGEVSGMASDTSSGPRRKEVVTVLHSLRSLGSTTCNNLLARLIIKGAENLKKNVTTCNAIKL
jgi:hypothetical protein